MRWLKTQNESTKCTKESTLARKKILGNRVTTIIGKDEGALIAEIILVLSMKDMLLPLQ